MSSPRRYNHFNTYRALQKYFQINQQMPTVAELVSLTGTSTFTAYTHLQRLEADGYIFRAAANVARGIAFTGKEPPTEIPARSKLKTKKYRHRKTVNSYGPLPKLSKAQLERNIERVAAKAEAREAQQRAMPNEDVIYGSYGKRQLIHLKAAKIG